MIQISKKAFNTPNDYNAISKEFTDAVNKITGEVNNRLSFILNLLGLGKKNTKTVLYLESPGYEGVMKELKKRGNPDLDWLRLNTKIPIAGPFSEDYHSFTVLTKEHKDASSPLFSGKGMFETGKNILSEGIKAIINGRKTEIEPTWIAAKINQIFSEKINLITDGVPVKKFVIDDLSELPEVFKQIDY